MTHQDHIPAQAIPPHARLIQMITGTWVSGALVAAAKLNLADQLAGGPKSAADLAASMHVHASSLHRLMRTLASLGLLASRPDGRYELTALGEALKTGAPGAAKATVLSFGSDWFQSTWSQLSYSVETGETGFEKAHGMRLFDYLAQHPDDAARFSETMVGIHGQEPRPWPPRTIFRHFTSLLTWVARQETSSPRFLLIMRDRAAYCLICRMWWARRRHCSSRKALMAA